MPDRLTHGIVAPSAAAAVDLAPSRVRLITAGVILASFLSALEATVVSTAMPTIVQTLGGESIYAWVFTAYMLTMTVSGPLWGRVSDLYGRRRVYLVSIVLFLAGSACSGQAHSMAELIGWRLVQGLGGGGLTPIGQTVLAEIYSLADRARVQGMITSIFGVASLAGPAVGGFLAQDVSWRWVFYINLPFGLCGIVLLASTMPGDPPKNPDVHLDRSGAVLLSSALTALLLVLENAKSWGYGSPLTLLALLGTLVLLAAFYTVERRVPQALVPLVLFRQRLVLGVCVVMTLIGMALYGAITYIPLYCQSVLGYTPLDAGRVLTPLMVGWIAFSGIGTRIVLRIGFRAIALIGLTANAAGFLVLTLLGAQGSAAGLFCAASLLGVGAGLCMAPLVIGAQSAVEHRELGIATSLVLLMRSVGGAIGVTAMGAAMGSVSFTGLHHAFQLGLVVSLAAFAGALLLPRKA